MIKQIVGDTELEQKLLKQVLGATKQNQFKDINRLQKKWYKNKILQNKGWAPQKQNLSEDKNIAVEM